jgi:3-deoxy-manno-octulosonate cytidylyltransferase (CMP-KDO synthetase)
MFSAVGVIPARYGSSRLPGKPLADLQGKPLLYHVYHRASQAQTLDEVWIATDDERVYNAAKSFGATVMMTRSDHRSGTDRIAEAAAASTAEIIVNIQGDEPLMDPFVVDDAVRILREDVGAEMATLRAPIHDFEDVLNPNVVKVVTDEHGYAVYFSRAPIPYPRAKGLSGSSLQEIVRNNPRLLKHYYRHIGLYAYRRRFLMQFSKWEPSPLELLEDLEQLRAIEHGTKIKVATAPAAPMGIDTPEDLERIRRMVERNPGLMEA